MGSCGHAGLALARPPRCRDNARGDSTGGVAESRLASPLGSERLPSKTHGGYCWWFARSLTPGGPELRAMAAPPLSLTNLRNERLRGDRGSHGDERESAILGP
jgi:hypothetical protein